MKMRKTIVLAAAVFLLSLCVSACGNTGQAGAGSPAAKAEESDAEVSPAEVSPQAPEQEPAEFQPEDVQEALEAQSDTDIEADAGLQANIDAHTDTADPKENTDRSLCRAGGGARGSSRCPLPPLYGAGKSADRHGRRQSDLYRSLFRRRV